MKGDFTRDTFKHYKHFSRVLSQQGRVQLDADWNEQTAILLHFLRNLAADLIGQHGGPENDYGFRIGPIGGVANDFGIGPGRYYVDGVLCEIEPSEAVSITVNGDEVTIPSATNVKFTKSEYVEIFDDASGVTEFHQIKGAQGSQLTLYDPIAGSFADPMIRQAFTYKNQPDFLAAADVIPTNDNDSYLVYLDVWERHLTWVEDESIREVGLGGPDTATRAKVVWQVKTASVIPNLSGPSENRVSDLDWRTYVTALQPADHGLLRARVRPEATSTDPCITSPKSSYRGAENQLYRVEVHSGSLDENGTAITPAFKWSRENGSVVFAISKLSGALVTVENLGRDSRLGLKVADYVEVVDDDYALQDRANPLLQVMDIDRTAIVVTLSGAPNGPIGQAPLKHPLLRRWDANAANIVEATSADDAWLDLEDGIQIQFQPGGTYRTGDYWLIPARVATGDVEWPKLRDAQGKLVLDERGQPQPVALPPHGVEHHYAPLAVIEVENGNVSSPVTDLRRKFSPAAPE